MSETQERSLDLTDHVRAGARTCGLTIGGERHDVEALLDSGLALVSEACRAAEATAVATVLDNDAGSVEIVLGAIASRTPLVSLPVPNPRQPLEDYLDMLADLLSDCGEVAVVGLDAFGEAVETVVTQARDRRPPDPVPLAPAGRFTLTQFTSGTTGTPRGVVVDQEALLASAEASFELVSADPGETLCSWLPLSHDLGLVGMFLMPMIASSPAYLGRTNIDLMSPMAFLRQPRTWLERMSDTGAVLTAAPDSSLRHLVRTCKGSSLPDLSRLREMVVGAEVNRPTTMQATTDLLHAAGAPATALCPGYGMAEASLTVCLTPQGTGYRTVRAALPGDDEEHEWVTAGVPLPGYVVTANATEGTLRVKGPGLGSRYLDGEPVADEEGFFQTSDLGVVLGDGSVVPMGRIDDTLLLNGRNVPAAIVDLAMQDVAGLRANRAFACMLTDGSWGVVAELRGEDGVDVTAVLGELRRRAATATGASPEVVIAAPARAIPFTTSGKLKRSQLGRLVSSGALPELARL